MLELILYSQLWISQVLFSPYGDLRPIRPVLKLNLPTLRLSCIIHYIWFNWPSFKFALRSEGKKGENKTGAKFSLYIVCFLQASAMNTDWLLLDTLQLTIQKFMIF